MPGSQPERVEARLARVDPPAEMRRLRGTELLPVPPDHAREVAVAVHVEDLTGGDGRPGERPDLREQGLRNSCVAAGRFLDDLLAGDDRAGVLVGADEYRVE